MDMNVKGVDEQLVLRAKAAALDSGQSLKDWVMGLMKNGLGIEVVSNGGPRPAFLLRFRSQQQYDMAKSLASQMGISINEFILQWIESRDEFSRGENDNGEMRAGRGSVQEAPARKQRPVQAVRKSKGTDGPAGVEPEVDEKVKAKKSHDGAEVAVCKRCNHPVKRDPKNPKYWLCPKGDRRCGRQLDDSEVA